MNVRLLVTTLVCLLALGGCINVTEPLADSDASMGEPGESAVISPGPGEGTGGGFAGAAGFGGEGVAVDGVGGGPGEAFLDGGAPPLGVDCLDGTSRPCTMPDGSVSGEAEANASDAAVAVDPATGLPVGPDGSAIWREPQLGTRSTGCELVDGEDLCMGEGWMLADGEGLPACGESGAYRICTFAADACVSHTVMMVQRCDD